MSLVIRCFTGYYCDCDFSSLMGGRLFDAAENVSGCCFGSEWKQQKTYLLSDDECIVSNGTGPFSTVSTYSNVNYTNKPRDI